jgi:hypothetical protein
MNAKTDADNKPAVVGRVERSVRPHVGDSAFEGWFEDFVHSGKGTKQAMREAYLAGLDEGFNGQLGAAALERKVARLDALLRAMQADARTYLTPDSGCGADYWFVGRMLRHLDGPEQRSAQGMKHD